MHHQYVFSTQLVHHFSNRAAEFAREHANHKTFNSGRIRKRAEQVENTANTQFFTWPNCIFHGFMMVWRKQETYAHIADTAFSLLHVQVKVNSSLFQQVRGT